MCCLLKYFLGGINTSVMFFLPYNIKVLRTFDFVIKGILNRGLLKILAQTNKQKTVHKRIKINMYNLLLLHIKPVVILF